MAFTQELSGILAVDGSGDGTLTLPTAASDGNLTGVILEIRHDADGTAPYADGFDFTLTGNESGKTFYAETIASTGDFVRRPALPTHLAADGTVATAEDLAAITNEKLLITVASGGASKTGVWTVTIG